MRVTLRLRNCHSGGRSCVQGPHNAEIEAPTPIRASTPDDISSIQHPINQVPRLCLFLKLSSSNTSIKLREHQPTFSHNISIMRTSTLVGASLIGFAAAHGDHAKTGGAPEVPADANWMTKHMAGQ